MEDFNQVKDGLIDMLKEIEVQLTDVADNGVLNDFESISEQQADNKEALFAEDKNTRYKEIENIKKAILRIDQGTYGVCLICGQVIKRKQLNSTPFSTHCNHCLEKKHDNRS